jgi:hypothetical protein
MKIRVILPTVAAALLLMSVAASAANSASAPASNSANTTPVQVLSTTLPEWSPNCADSVSVVHPLVFNPAPAERTSFPCGSCSVPACQGMNLGDTCAFIGGRSYECYMISFCGSGPGTGRFCDCSAAPY